MKKIYPILLALMFCFVACSNDRSGNPLTDEEDPAKPTELKTELQQNAVLLSWKKDANSSTYQIFRSPTTQKDGIIGTTDTTQFQDTAVVDEKTYEYWVRGVGPGDERGPGILGTKSNPKSVTYYAPQLVLVGNPNQTLDFGDDRMTLDLTFKNKGGGLIQWEIPDEIPWAEFTPSKGSVGGEPFSATAEVDRELSVNAYEEATTLKGNLGDPIDLIIKMEISDEPVLVVELSQPEKEKVELCPGDEDNIKVGNAGKGDADNLLTKGFIKDLVIEPIETEEKSTRGFAVLFACSVGERAYEWPEKKQGVFSYYLVHGFRSEAVDKDGHVTVTSLATYLQQQVTAWSKRYRRSGHEQTPWLHLDGQPPMVLQSAEEHALWQAMDSLISSAERKNWSSTPTAYIKHIAQEIDDLLRQDIERTGELLVVDDPLDAKVTLGGEYEKLSGDSKRLTLRLRGEPSWTCVATGFPSRSKGGAFFASLFPGGGQIYMKKRRWLTIVQVGLGFSFGASSIWHKDKYDEYKNLREVTRAELDAAYDETVLPHRLRIVSGIAFGSLWLLNTILAVNDAGEYQEMRQRSELETNPMLSLEPMPGGVRFSRRF